MTTLTAARRRLLDELLCELAADDRAAHHLWTIAHVRDCNRDLGALDDADLDEPVIGVPV